MPIELHLTSCIADTEVRQDKTVREKYSLCLPYEGELLILADITHTYKTDNDCVTFWEFTIDIEKNNQWLILQDYINNIIVDYLSLCKCLFETSDVYIIKMNSERNINIFDMEKADLVSILDMMIECPIP